MPRLVYSLHFTTEQAAGGALPLESIVPLDRAGKSRNIRPLGKARVVDLRPGDSFLHRPTQKQYKLWAMSAYRQHPLSEEDVASGNFPADGYLVPR
jgi:hypothetical protein